MNISLQLRNYARGFLLLILALVFYWLPMLIWLAGELVGSSTELMPETPFWQVIWVTLYLSMIIAMFSTFITIPVAIVWFTSSNPLKQIIVWLMLIPLVMGLLARNYSWIGMLSKQNSLFSMGWEIFERNSILYTQKGIVIVMVCLFVPVAFFILAQGISQITANQLNAARVMGMKDWQFVFKVMIPVMYRSVLVTICLILSMSVGFFITPHMIGGGKSEFISNLILNEVNLGQFGRASILSLRFLLIVVIPVAMTVYLILKRRQLITGK